VTQQAIEVKGLWKVYGPKKENVPLDQPDKLSKMEESREAVVAVRDVSFSVNAGEVFVVMGLSGSGKSTLIRCLMRLVEPTAGTIKMNGEEVTSLNNQELTQFRRNSAAMVFQHYGLLPHRTVLENVSFGLNLKKVPRKEREERAIELLNTVGLDGWEAYYPANLSGGMQQRVGIARALASDPPILLMDEPFSGLDPLIRREMQEEMVALHEKTHKTIFFVTHDLDEGIRLGDRMAVMRDGLFVQVGTPEEILENPADDYVARFVEDKKELFQEAKKEHGDDENREGMTEDVS